MTARLQRRFAMNLYHKCNDEIFFFIFFKNFDKVYLYCKKPCCSKSIYFQISREAFDPIYGECLLSNQQKILIKVYNYQILKFINDVNPWEGNLL